MMSGLVVGGLWPSCAVCIIKLGSVAVMLTVLFVCLFAALICRAYARRDGFRVPWKRDRRALHPPDQCVRQRRRGAGAARQPVVRPKSRLPLLLCSLEQ